MGDPRPRTRPRRAGSVHILRTASCGVAGSLWGPLLIAVGALGLIERTPAWHGWMGVLFGVGLALVVDEAALLIQLKDVYWDGAGGVSVAIAVILIGAAGGVLALTRLKGVDEVEDADDEDTNDA